MDGSAVGRGQPGGRLGLQREPHGLYTQRDRIHARDTYTNIGFCKGAQVALPLYLKEEIGRVAPLLERAEGCSKGTVSGYENHRVPGNKRARREA